MSKNLHPGHAALRKLIPDAEKRHALVRALFTVRFRQKIRAKDVDTYFQVTPTHRDLLVSEQDAQQIADFLNDI